MGNYISASNVTNWVSGETEANKTAKILWAEQVIEKCTRDYFYAVAFDVYRNGNDKDKLFLGLIPSIISITAVYVYNEEISSDAYSNNSYSIYMQSGSYPPRPPSEKICLFPKGVNNIRVTGTYGNSSCPEAIKRACIMIVEEDNVPGTHGQMIQGSESLGNQYDYENKNKAWTGIKKVDDIIAMYYKKKILLGG